MGAFEVYVFYIYTMFMSLSGVSIPQGVDDCAVMQAIHVTFKYDDFATDEEIAQAVYGLRAVGTKVFDTSRHMSAPQRKRNYALALKVARKVGKRENGKAVPRSFKRRVRRCLAPRLR